MTISVEVDYKELEKHKICTYGGVYLKKFPDESFEIRCCSRFHGGNDLLIVAIPAPSNTACTPTNGAGLQAETISTPAIRG